MQYSIEIFVVITLLKTRKTFEEVRLMPNYSNQLIVSHYRNIAKKQIFTNKSWYKYFYFVKLRIHITMASILY